MTYVHYSKHEKYPISTIDLHREFNEAQVYYLNLESMLFNHHDRGCWDSKSHEIVGNWTFKPVSDDFGALGNLDTTSR